MTHNQMNKKRYQKPRLNVIGDANKITKSGVNMEYSDEYSGRQPYP